jgi:hypothetical protein
VAERVNTNGEKVFIVRATDDEIHNKEAAAISKALRNEGLRVIPQDIIDEAMDTARDTLKNRDKADPDAAKKKLLDSFSEIGVKPKDLQVYLKHSTDQLNPSELQDLRSIYRAIKDGEARWSDYVQPSDTEELTKTKAAQLKDKLKSATGKSAQEPMSDPCPNNGDSFKESYCAGCPTRTGCPAWGTP